MFKERLVKPESGNRYYQRTTTGGYGTAIQGFPVQVGTDVLSNCVGYAAGRFNEIYHEETGYDGWKWLNYPPNAEDFIARAKTEGLEISQNPDLGAIIVWAKGQTGVSADGAGHVAIVERVNSDGTILTSESGYNCSNPFWTTLRNNKDGNWNGGSAYRFLGFILQPRKEGRIIVLKKGQFGENVKEMQKKLFEAGYLRENEIDGDFGNITLGALLAFQFENDLEIDGCCGPESQKYLGLNLK